MRTIGVTLLLAATAVSRGTPPPERITVCPVDRYPNSNYPSIDRLADGRLVCVFSARGRDTGNKLVVAGSFSADHGRTWTAPVVLIDTKGQEDYDPGLVVIGTRIIVSSTTTPPGAAISTSRTIAVRSDDNGRTWSLPYDIPMGHRYTSGKINNGLVLRDGVVVFGYTYEPQLDTVRELKAEGDMIQRSGVMISRDRGLNWTAGGDATDDTLKISERRGAIRGICEPAIVELADGSLYMLARTGMERLYQARSRDGGRTWSKPVPSPLVGHNAPAALCRFAGEKPGILVVWNNSPVDRWPLCAAASFDEANTWTPPRELANTVGLQCSYPGCTQAADGSLVVVWQQARRDGCEIHAARFRPEWLTAAPTASAPAPPAPASDETVLHAWPLREVDLGPIRVSVGGIRVVMRGPMFPRLAAFSDGSVILTADAAEEGGATTSIRSPDRGDTWKPFQSPLTAGAGPNTCEFADGRALAMAYATKPLADRPGAYQTTRWESADRGLNARGPLTDGVLRLPADAFDSRLVQWFHGNVIAMPDGTLLAAMQGRHARGADRPFRCFVSRSADRGRTWEYLSMVATLDSIDDPEGETGRGWQLHGPCEPNILRLGDGRLVCAMRLVNDDDAPQMGPAEDRYHDLSCVLPGSGIHPGTIKLPADRYYRPGPPTVPLIISFSSDNGRTWTRPRPMRPGRGCFPRMARSGDVLAVTYGALAYPRWGNCISFSLDGGKTWTREIDFGPFFTTGYTDIVETGPCRYLCVFDCTPPQPWKDHAAHWVGAVDVAVQCKKERGASR